MTRSEQLVRPAVAVLLLAATLAAAGCGRRGPPLPPQPRGPLPPTTVAARQLGGAVVVSFQVPGARGPRLSQHLLEAELVRITYLPGLSPPVDPDVFRRRGEIVGTASADPLPAGERQQIDDGHLDEIADRGEGWTLRYGVRLRDRKGRPSPLALAPDLVPRSPVRPPRDLRAEPTADGVRLSWSPPETGAAASYNVYRTSAGETWPEMPLNSAPSARTDFLDAKVEVGANYTYAVRVALGEGPPYYESESSGEVDVLAEDRFAPEPPSGLVAVQEGPAVRLFWDPNSERDVGGYFVYRRTEDGEWARLTADPIVQPLFLDTGIQVGWNVAYRVTAVDRATPPNESEPSRPQELQVVTEPVSPPGSAQ